MSMFVGRREKEFKNFKERKIEDGLEIEPSSLMFAVGNCLPSFLAPPAAAAADAKDEDDYDDDGKLLVHLPLTKN